MALLTAIVCAVALPAVGEAEETGGISGTVTAEGGAFQGVDVCVYASGDLGTAIGCQLTGPTGTYEVTGLPAGQYVVEFTPPAPAEYLTQWYSGASSAGSATAVEVTAEAITPGINAALVKKPPPGPGSISGKVTAAEGGQAVAGVEVCAVRSGGGSPLCATTSASGEYAIAGVAAGQYTVEFTPPAPAEYFKQWYSGAASADLATLVSVTAETLTPGIDATLIKVPPSGPGAIKGKVTAAGSGQPVKGVEACAEQVGVAGTFCELTSPTGEYEIGGLTAGQYTVEFTPPAPVEYFTQWYSGATSKAAATAVSVSAGTVTSGIDVALQKVPSGPGTIRGKVTEAETGLPAPGVKVCAVQVGVEGPRCVFTTSPDGEYEISELPAGQWKLTFGAQTTNLNLLSLSYPNKEFWEAPTPVTLAAGDQKTINIALKTGGQISGTALLAATGTPLAGVRVCLTEAGLSLACLTTPPSGAYRFHGVWPGSFKVVFSAAPGEFPDPTPIVDGYSTQWWAGQATLATATPIAIAPPASVYGIDASLTPLPAASPHSSPAPPAAVGAVAAKKQAKPLKCKQGFAKRKVKGKARCVKLKKHVKKKSAAKHQKHKKKS